jgi:hypothetical protein
MRILLLPPDERPVSTRLPQMVGACGGADVVVPPEEVLPSFRQPADHDALADWLGEKAPEFDGVVISLDLIAHGGLVPSRLTGHRLPEVMERLDIVRRLPLRPGVRCLAAMVVTRVPNLDDATEEPEYWARHGRELHALSAVLSDARNGRATEADVNRARARIPDDIVHDWLQRRLRNHGANLGALELASDGSVDVLALTADDTAPRGLPAAERARLEELVGQLRIGERVFQYPGADEVPSVLVARMLGPATPARVAVHAADTDGLGRVAPYEDRPVIDTVRAQVAAAGAEIVDHVDDADLVLAVHPPSGDAGDWALSPPVDVSPVGHTLQLADDVARFVEAGQPVALADCRWPNGGDPGLVSALAERGALDGLAAYAGWNTAGNSIGTAIAHGLVRLGGDDRASTLASERLLVHRLVEDISYQTIIRSELRTLIAHDLGAAEAEMTQRLDQELAGFGELGKRWRVRPGSTRLPWQRAFECDFALERVSP